jgi:hypothetical protein
LTASALRGLMIDTARKPSPHNWQAADDEAAGTLGCARSEEIGVDG